MNDLQITVKGDVDERAVRQLERCAIAGDAPAAALCADGHVGYSQPIGGVVAYHEKISPSGVGYDIGCGNEAVKTDVRADALGGDLSRIMDEIAARISFGMGRVNEEPLDHPVLEKIARADFEPQRQFAHMAGQQLGTVGSGNHYVDLFEDEDGWVWVGVHFGSRGFGHKTATGFLALAQGRAFDEKAPEGEMDSPPILLDTASELGQAYIAAMQLAGEYAYAGRDVVCAKVLEILGAEAVEEVHNHHNFAWLETHANHDVWVIRKGATPAWPGQKGFVGATMGEPSVILEGVDHPDAKDLLYSTVHGAGRVMSRTEAAGRKRRRWACNTRDCEWTQPPGSHKPETCPRCGGTSFGKRWVQDRPGKVDWPSVTAALAERGIELRGGGADEAPEAYKRLDQVLAAHGGTVRVLHTLRPLGVAMAGADIYDPFKD